ncbi:hypothetical protein AB836_01845 [Rickettsiales bacterium (ex Bugula neritina AB1)]|nr:hypothetical protein AB836_01845 [Rickettsiales bacterium (ex Bugula neritina AB1)]
MASLGAIERNKKIKKFSKIHYSKKQELKKKIKILYKEALQIQDSKQRKEKIYEVFKLQGKLDNFSPWSIKDRYRNRCLVTGDPRSYYRLFGLGRNYMRLNMTEIPGLSKFSW